jgi:rod shape-determining protein MreD
MSRHPSQPLHPLVWLGVPMLLCAAATLLLATPFRLFGLSLPEPVFAMVLAFAWATIRPSILGPFALLLIGLFQDLFWGAPLGLWALSLLIAYFCALLTRNLMVGQSGQVLWGWYVAICLVGFACACGLTIVGSGVAPTMLGVGLQLLATAVLYPVAQQLIDRFEDADVRFR